MGNSDLFPISYLQMGLNAGNSICRIQIRDNKGSFVGSGTGFLVSENVLMTNNHVIDSMQTALNSLVEFNYQDDENFMPCPTHTFRLNPEKFFVTDEDLDFTMVAIKDNPLNEKHPYDFLMGDRSLSLLERIGSAQFLMTLYIILPIPNRVHQVHRYLMISGLLWLCIIQGCRIRIKRMNGLEMKVYASVLSRIILHSITMI